MNKKYKLVFIFVVILSIIVVVSKWFLIPRFKLTIKNLNKISYHPKKIKSDLVITRDDLEYYKKLFIPTFNTRVNRNFIEQREDPIDHHVIQNIQFQQDYTGSQNVHDSIVQDITVNKFNKLQSYPWQDNNIIEWCSQKSPEKLNDLQDVISKISERNSTVSNLGMSKEMDIIETVWKASSEAVKEQIISELIDCKDTDSIVCPTGVVSRVINADIIENVEKAPKTKQILRDEMMNTAILVRNILENDPDYIGKSDSAQLQMFKNSLVDKYSSDYSGIVSNDIIQKELDEWLGCI
jgi:hypothetical protein